MSPFSPAFAGDLVAVRAGLFEREGVRIEIEAGRTVEDAITSVTEGQDTFGVTRADTSSRPVPREPASLPLLLFY